MTEATARTVRLPDGRSLETIAYGSASAARTVVFHDGAPTAAVPAPALDRAASERDARVVAWSRPGYAGSDPQPGRRVADVVADGHVVLAELDVEDYVVLGWSGGSPHALAHASLDAPRCRAAATIGGPSPLDASIDAHDWMAGMGAENIVEFSAAFAGATPLAALLEEYAGGIGELTADGLVAGMGDLLGAADRDALTTEQAESLAAAMRRSVSSGIAGWRDDDLAFVGDWGVDLTSIAVPVTLWQGEDDRMVPPRHAERLAAVIPEVRLVLNPTEGHLSWWHRLGEILDDLLARAGHTA